MLIRLTFGVIFTFSLPMSTPRTPEESFKPLQGCLRCMVGSCDHSVKISATCWWWTRCSLSPWSCRRLLQAPLASVLLVLSAPHAIWITTSIQLRTWIVDTGIAHTQETSQTTHLDISGDIRSKKKSVSSAFHCHACGYV